jgi:hypothetical protein
LAAAKAGAVPPSAEAIFGALSDASIACPEVIDAYGDRPIPEDVRAGLFKVHGSLAGLAASLKLYVIPTIRSS